VNTQGTDLQSKLHKLIEQYTMDKKRLTELEAELTEKTNELESLKANDSKYYDELQSALNQVKKLTMENETLIKKNLELEKVVSGFESFANELNTQIDSLLPIVEKP